VNLVDPASRDMLLSRVKPCMFQSTRNACITEGLRMAH